MDDNWFGIFVIALLAGLAAGLFVYGIQLSVQEQDNQKKNTEMVQRLQDTGNRLRAQDGLFAYQEATR